MIIHSYPKINIGLNILNKREDGYHNIETIFYPIFLFTDTLSISPFKNGIKFSTRGKYHVPDDSSNLCLKAVNLLRTDYRFIDNFVLELNKNIPIGAGLGGGSSNAAATLKLLNQYFELQLSEQDLIILAAKLGSDVPFFIKSSPSLGTGRGEILEPITLDLKNKKISIIETDIHISTAEAYANCEPKMPTTSLKEAIKLPIVEWKNQIINQFEKPIFSKFPVLATIKDELYRLGADYVSLTGSGSAIYAIGDQRYEL
jgi:4-diphosphocytidyl-2-C-methyl-D-erythritol kinase